jgi:hypothetical protein
VVRRAIDSLRTYETSLPPVTDVVKMDYLLQLGHEPQRYAVIEGRNDIQRKLVQTALAVPWEQARVRGILATLYAGLLRTAETTVPDALRRISEAIPSNDERSLALSGWTPPPGDATASRRAGRQLADLLHDSIWLNAPMSTGPFLFGQEASVRTQLRAAQLQLALILHQTQHGKPAESLSALVPSILPALPGDPYADGPFHYRLSAGEDVVWYGGRADDSGKRRVAAGQGILWSDGPDLENDGGRVNSLFVWRYTGWKPGADILYLVPLVKDH